MKSQSAQDYLKAIYTIQERSAGQPVSTSNLANHLGVASASVTGMLKRFSSTDPKLVEYEPYAGVTLTAAGEKIALEVIRHHRLIESFLSHSLGYSWDEVHAEAERLEHVISEEMEERMAHALGHPTFDPHGDPIPDREGNLPNSESILLSQLAEGETASIMRISGQEPEMLRYFAKHGLVISASLRVITRAPFNGPITVQVGDYERQPLALGRNIADHIHVRPVRESFKEFSHEKER